jgi:hypothetical protein
MRRFMVGDRVRVKYWNTKRPDFVLTGIVIACHNSGWYTIKHDDVAAETFRRAKGRYDALVGPRYDWQEADLTHRCGLLRFLAAIQTGDTTAHLSA